MIRAEAVYWVSCDFCGNDRIIDERRYELALLNLESMGWKVKKVVVNGKATIPVLYCHDCVKEGHIPDVGPFLIA